MTAILILLAAAVLGFLYTRALNKLSGEEIMTLGVLALIPYGLIAAGAVVALLTLT